MPINARQRPRLLITAGPTHEPIDLVRYLGNRSSGRLGIALANQSILRGWPTTLLLGPTSAEPATFPHESLKRFRTTAELQALLAEQWARHDVLIMAAAVADYRPAHPSLNTKLRRENKKLSLELEPTPDLLAELASITRPDQLVIGFALEPPEALEESAKRKLTAKNVDAIVANPIATLDSKTIDATLFLRDGTQRSPGKPVSKWDFAEWLLEEVAILRVQTTDPSL